MANYTLSQTDSELTIRWRAPLFAILAVGGFMSVWLTGWTFGCVDLIRGILKEPAIGTILFAVPFLIGWLAGAGVLLSTLLGRDTIRLDSTGLQRTWSVLLLKWTKHLSLEELDRFEAVPPRENNRGYQIRVGDFEFGNGKEADMNDLADRMNELLVTLRPGYIVKPREIEEEESIRSFDIPLDRRPEGREKPEDSPWTYWSDFDRFGFLAQGVFSFSDLIAALFPAAFWNGIVSIFVGVLLGIVPMDEAPQGGSWWFLFFFLIPFELIGLSLIWNFLKTLLPSQHIVKWTFSSGKSEYRHSFLGLGKTRTVSLEGWKTLEIREDTECESTRPWSVVFLGNRSTVERLASRDRLREFQSDLSRSDKDDILDEFDELTENEARWIADVILREQRSIRSVPTA